MRLEISKIQQAKTGVHALQAVLIFVAACITISIFTKPGSTDSRTGWYFGVCWLTIPALIYLVAVPMWSRAHRFANAYAFAAVDVVYTIFWLSAFAAVAAYSRDGILQGAADKKIDSSNANCTTFKFGPEAKCTLSYSTMSLGIVIFLLFIGTSGISILYLMKQRKEPTQDPWLSESKQYEPTPGSLEGRGSKDPIWSADTGEIDGPYRRTSAESHGHIASDHQEEQDDYGLLHGTNTTDGHHPGRPWVSTAPQQQVDTEYRGAHYQAPSALSPDEYRADVSPSVYSPATGTAGRVDFPSAPQGYESRLAGSYSFSGQNNR